MGTPSDSPTGTGESQAHDQHFDLGFLGGDDGTRTHDPLLAKQIWCSPGGRVPSRAMLARVAVYRTARRRTPCSAGGEPSAKGSLMTPRRELLRRVEVVARRPTWLRHWLRRLRSDRERIILGKL